MKKATGIRIAVLSSLLLTVTELAVRLFGIGDFPTYDVENGVGYIPKPNQSGSFLHTHAWVFNDRSMGTPSPWNPARRPDILLIGNSIVMGGNPFDQKEKLGPLILQRIGEAYAVWPIAAGGWTNVNEMVYLDRNPDVAASARYFVWEYMRGGLSALAQWKSDYVFPRERPLWASWYAFRRYIWPHLYHEHMSELPPVGAPNPEQVKRFAGAVAGLCHRTKPACAGILFLYPVKTELLLARQEQEWLKERTELERIAQANGLPVVDISKRAEWNESLYREDGVHPTVEGNVALAAILSGAIQEGLQH